MYLLIDQYGVIRGKTSDRKLVLPLRDALESVMQCTVYIARKTAAGTYVFGM